MIKKICSRHCEARSNPYSTAQNQRFTTSIAVATTSIRIIWSIYTWTKLRTTKYHPLPHSSRHLAYRASSRLSFSLRSQICETIRAHQRKTRVVTTICDICISDWRYDRVAISTKPKPQNTSTIELSLILSEKRKRRIYEMRRVRRIVIMEKVYRKIGFCKNRKISILKAKKQLLITTRKQIMSQKISYIFIWILSMSGLVSAAVNYSEYFPNWSTALQSQSNGWATPVSSSKEIMTPEWCRKITSSQSSQKLIPTRTMNEWVSFRDHIPSGITINNNS